MIYTDSHRWRDVLIVLMILCLTTFATLWYAGKLSVLTNFSFLKGQILTPLSASDLDYLKNSSGYTPIETTKTLEDVSQHFIETLLKASSTDFDKKNSLAAQTYLVNYYRLTQPIPATITQAIKTSVDRFMAFSSTNVNLPTSTSSSLTTSVTLPQTPPEITSSTPITREQFTERTQSIVAEHRSSATKEKSSERSQVARSLLDLFVSQLASPPPTSPAPSP